MVARRFWIASLLATAIAPLADTASAVWWGTYGSWDSQARRNAADASMRAVVDRLNAYGNFDWGNDGWVDVYYKAGVPTAQASYYGSVDFGGTWPNERVTQHEMNHWLGTGTYWNWENQFSNSVWTGPRVNALVKQFDGDQAVIRRAGYHFYPYGLNYDSEVVDAATLMRNVALTYAMRQDMGNGDADNPWSATRVTLTGSDPIGTSAFNWYGGGWSGPSYPGWDDKYVPHAGAAYFTGDHIIRTPLHAYNPSANTPSFTFGGGSLTVNNTNGVGGGLLFKGVGTGSVITIPNLLLDGGYVRHASGSGDLFQLAGNVVLRNGPTIDAAQGDIRLLGMVSGTGSLTKKGNRSLTLAAAQNTYTGGTVVEAGTLVLEGGGGSGAIRGSLTIKPGGTVQLAAVDALGWQSGSTAVTQINIEGTLDNMVSGNNGSLANWTLTGGTMASSGGGAYQIRAGVGRVIRTLASSRSSFIRGDVAIRDANATLPIIVENGPAPVDLWISGVIQDSSYEPGSNGIRKEGTGTLVLGAANTYTGTTTVRAGTLQVSHARALATSPVTVEEGATLLFAGGLEIETPAVHLAGGTLAAGSLRVGSGGIGGLTVSAGTLAGGMTIDVAGDGLVTLASETRLTASLSGLTVAAEAGGMLDLGAGQVVVAAGGITPAAVRAGIIAGRAGGGWDGGSGIGSSLAAASGGTRAVGYLFRPDGAAVVSFAAPGDLNLDGVVDIFDLAAIDTSGAYGTGATADWSVGDVNYDGVTNVFDVLAISTSGSYGQGNYFPPLAGGTITAVPEPAWLLPCSALAALAMLRHRTRPRA